MTLCHILGWIPYKNIKFTQRTRQLIADISSLIAKLTQPNPLKRIDVTEAAQIYASIMRTHNLVKKY